MTQVTIIRPKNHFYIIVVIITFEPRYKGKVACLEIAFLKKNLIWDIQSALYRKTHEWSCCLKTNYFPACYLFPGTAHIADDITRASSAPENKQMKHTIGSCGNSPGLPNGKEQKWGGKTFCFQSTRILIIKIKRSILWLRFPGRGVSSGQKNITNFCIWGICISWCHLPWLGLGTCFSETQTLRKNLTNST